MNTDSSDSSTPDHNLFVICDHVIQYGTEINTFLNKMYLGFIGYWCQLPYYVLYLFTYVADWQKEHRMEYCIEDSLQIYITKTSLSLKENGKDRISVLDNDCVYETCRDLVLAAVNSNLSGGVLGVKKQDLVQEAIEMYACYVALPLCKEQMIKLYKENPTDLQ